MVTPSHCPLCSLVFAHRTELEWHVRTEHRSAADERAEVEADISQALRRSVDEAELERLRHLRNWPSVSIFLPTVPAAQMTSLDATRLRRLARQARRELQPHPDPRVRTTLEQHLDRLVDALEGSPTSRATILFLSPSDVAVMSLPIPTGELVAISDRFAIEEIPAATGA